MHHVRVTHRRQFTGSVFAGVSMIVRAVGDDLGILVGQQLRSDNPGLRICAGKPNCTQLSPGSIPFLWN